MSLIHNFQSPTMDKTLRLHPAEHGHVVRGAAIMSSHSDVP